jgi:hypothetical protein
MTDYFGAPSPSTILRWTALLVVAASAGFVADYSTLTESATIAEVMAEYGNTLVPTGFAKAICVGILISFVPFVFAALWPSRHHKPVYDRLVVPLALASVVTASWIVAFRQKEIGLSVALIAASVALGGVMFLRAASADASKHSVWLRVPFSLYFGAMTVALLVVVSQWLNASGLLAETDVTPADVATAFLAIAVTLGGFVALRYSDFVYPAILASAVGAIFIAQRAYDPDVVAAALIVCGGMLVVAVLAAVAVARQPRRDSTTRAKTERRAKDEGWYLIEANSSIMRL